MIFSTSKLYFSLGLSAFFFLPLLFSVSSIFVLKYIFQFPIVFPTLLLHFLRREFSKLTLDKTSECHGGNFLFIVKGVLTWDFSRLVYCQPNKAYSPPSKMHYQRVAGVRCAPAADGPLRQHHHTAAYRAVGPLPSGRG